MQSMKDKLIVDERMKQFSRDVLHWINYDYVVINDNLEKCYLKIKSLIKQKLIMDQEIMILNLSEIMLKN